MPGLVPGYLQNDTYFDRPHTSGRHHGRVSLVSRKNGRSVNATMDHGITEPKMRDGHPRGLARLRCPGVPMTTLTRLKLV